ncbi:hypothetical protein T11_7004 [Trichinella zimbabwensis]|uniref:Uncharacterized protein n=1 Tax=Trichinella zimbabwensis TaxID=268475 RepID=A0A0V1G889_9BILA|nr:hypothetical protein T11_7004 [Trichinella zimbabwensis]
MSKQRRKSDWQQQILSWSFFKENHPNIPYIRRNFEAKVIVSRRSYF